MKNKHNDIYNTIYNEMTKKNGFKKITSSLDEIIEMHKIVIIENCDNNTLDNIEKLNKLRMLFIFEKNTPLYEELLLHIFEYL